ncbi:MAG TPA: hypothetical protein VKA46_07875, partial [Gemmataceae bacterium]|nr:hypothetical protein [Gemmataceae bacterium]
MITWSAALRASTTTGVAEPEIPGRATYQPNKSGGEQLRRAFCCVESSMTLALPDIPESERTPLVLTLLDLIHLRDEEIARLRDEIALLKGLK